ncbi:MAG: hypothetical protein ABG776_01935, partial [Cyanobacteria bacterium J06555_13]
RHIIQELSREAQKKSRLTQPLLDDRVPSPETTPDWLHNEEAISEQLYMRKAFAQLSELEQAILQLKVVKGLRWQAIQKALVKAGHPWMTPNLLSQKKRRALKKLEKSYKKAMAKKTVSKKTTRLTTMTD